MSTPSLWTKLDFSVSTKSKQAMGFLRRTGNKLLDVDQTLEYKDGGDGFEPFISATLRNIHRLQSLRITSHIFQLEAALMQFTRPAPELRYLRITNERNTTEMDPKLHSTIFNGQLPKLTGLALHSLDTNLRGFNFPSLTQFDLSSAVTIPLKDLTSFFERCPLLESVQLRLAYPISQNPTDPPRKRVRLAALKELRLDAAACVSGILDHLALPRCTELFLKGVFTGETHDQHGDPAARIHPSSIDYLAVTRGITKAIAMPNSCVFSGPNGNIRFWCFQGNRTEFNAEFFTSFSPLPVLEIRELWVTGDKHSPWKQTNSGVLSAFKVLTKVEDLTTVSCKTEAFFATLGSTIGGDVLLPGLRRLTIYGGWADLDIEALIQCAKARKGCSRPLEEVTVISEQDWGGHPIQEMESLREFVGELVCRIGGTPYYLTWANHRYFS